MQTAVSSKTTLQFNLTARRHTPQDTDIHFQGRYNDKSKVSLSTTILFLVCHISNIQHLYYIQHFTKATYTPTTPPSHPSSATRT